MKNQLFLDQLEQFTSAVENSFKARNFWLIRTDQGTLYDYFRGFKLVGLQHDEISLSELSKIREDNQLKNGQLRYDAIKQKLYELVLKKNQKKLDSIAKKKGVKSQDYTSLKTQISIRTSQIFRFVFELKKYDYVVIPSEGSEFITIGIVEENLYD